MEFTRIKYVGTKDYKDRTPLRTLWTPGDERQVPAPYAKALLRFAEFKKSETEPTEAEVIVAETAQVAVDEQVKQEDQTREAIIDLIETMDKDALATYAAKYDTVLDKRKKPQALRLEVANLVDQFGAR